MALDPLLPFAAAALAGILFADRFSPPLALLIGAAFVLFLLLSLSATVRRRAVPLLVLTAASFAVLHSLKTAAHEQFPFSVQLDRYPTISITAEAVVAEPPRALRRENHYRYTVRLIEIADGDEAWRTWHRVAVIQEGAPPAYGDHLRLRGELRPVRAARNPGEFSMDSFLMRKGIVAELHARDGSGIHVIAEGEGNPFYAFALSCRLWIQKAITRDLSDSPGVAAVLGAMVLGDTEGTPDEIENSFRHSGALHIFAVSGLHVGIFGFIVWNFLKLLGVRRSHSVFIIIPCLFFYAYVTGMRPSALRAAVMAGIYLGGFIVLRPARLLNSLAAAALLILAFDTRQLFLPGFQLSFAVLVFIALLATPFQRPLKRWINSDPFLPLSLVPPWRRGATRVGNYVAELVSVSAAAWIGSAPLGLWHFQLVTPIAVIANCVLVPLALVILSVSSLSLLSASIGLTSLSVLFNNANWCAVHALLSFSSAFASVPGSHFYVDHFPRWRPESCRVTVLDTGFGGSSQLISLAAPRRHLLVDAGGPGSVYDTVIPFLRGELHADLDTLAVTHGDVQHLAGAVLLLEYFHPRAVIESPLQNRSPYHKDLLEALASPAGAGISLQTVSAGTGLFASGDGLHSLRVLYPPANARHDYSADDQCLVLQLRSHSWRILFMADSGFMTEKWLLENVPAAELRSDVVVKGRHRSDFSGLPEFLNAVDPDAIIATHASLPETERIPAEWRTMLAAKGIRLFDQSETGAVTVRCTPRRIRVTSYLTGQSFSRVSE